MCRKVFFFFFFYDDSTKWVHDYYLIIVNTDFIITVIVCILIIIIIITILIYYYYYYIDLLLLSLLLFYHYYGIIFNDFGLFNGHKFDMWNFYLKIQDIWLHDESCDIKILDTYLLTFGFCVLLSQYFIIGVHRDYIMNILFFYLFGQASLTNMLKRNTLETITLRTVEPMEFQKGDE